MSRELLIRVRPEGCWAAVLQDGRPDWVYLEEADLLAAAPTGRAGNIYKGRVVNGAVHVEGRAAFEQAREYLDALAPDSASRARLHEGPEPLFSRYGIREESMQRTAAP
jgi:Ribonuclease G/E